MSRHIPIIQRPSSTSSFDIFQSPPRTLSASQGSGSTMNANNRHLAFSPSMANARPGSAGGSGLGIRARLEERGGVSGANGRRRPRSQVLGPSGEELVIRQWSSNAFEWTIRDLGGLRRDVESTEEERQAAADGEGGSSLHELLQGGLLIGDNKFRLDVIVNQPPAVESPSPVLEQSSDPSSTTATPSITSSSEPNTTDPSSQEPTMDLYLALLNADRIPSDDPSAAAIFLGIKPIDTSIGRRDGQPNWAWTLWEDATFCSDSDYWQCTLPTIDTLLAIPQIAERDAFTLVMQVQLPQSAAAVPFRPGMHLIARDLLDGIAASLDNANTGDVRFVCLEHKGQDAAEGSEDEAEDQAESRAEGEKDRMSGSVVGSHASAPQLYRKRVIFAHSDILKCRSDYFRDLLAFSSDAHNIVSPNPLGSPTRAQRKPESARQVHTIQCHDADFTTVYWLLHYLYTSELDFSPAEDVRAYVSRRTERTRSAARELVEPPKGMRLLAEWDWKLATQMEGVTSSSQTSRDGRDAEDHHTVRSAASISSVGTSISQRLSVEPNRISSAMTSSNSRTSTTSKVATSRPRPIPPTSSAKTTTAAARPTPARTVAPSRPIPTSPTRIPSIRTAKDTSPNAPLATPPPTHLPYPAHLHPARLASQQAVDPNPHPTPSPPPASGLAIYSLAHCYRLTALQDLAQNHLMENLTPEGAMPLLLASITYEELYKQTQDYIVENWAAVQAEPEFLICIQEVSGGSWGESGGLVLHGLFKRLQAAS